MQPDVPSDVSVCPTLRPVFTCNASEVGVLMWRHNGSEIITFTSSTSDNTVRTEGRFTATLISNQVVSGSAARNYLSTLTVQSLSDLEVGSTIECLDDEPSLQSIDINYTPIGNACAVCACCLIMFREGFVVHMCVHCVTNRLSFTQCL